MKLTKILQSPLESYRYLERYVNNGSPSGFTAITDISSDYLPNSYVDDFEIDLLKTNDLQFRKSNISEIQLDYLPVHPDVKVNRDYKANIMSVSPTSSSRTVMSMDEPNLFLKLHFDGKIGRAPREISLRRINRSIEINNLLEELEGKVKFGYLPESFGVYSDKLGFGAILRDSKPRNTNSRQYVPFFSLFSEDPFSQDRNLLDQLLSDSSKNYERLVDSLVDFYVDLSV